MLTRRLFPSHFFVDVPFFRADFAKILFVPLTAFLVAVCCLRGEKKIRGNDEKFFVNEMNSVEVESAVWDHKGDFLDVGWGKNLREVFGRIFVTDF
jgi:hypothetical protein